jgi:hypothetical protein
VRHTRSSCQLLDAGSDEWSGFFQVQRQDTKPIHDAGVHVNLVPLLEVATTESGFRVDHAMVALQRKPHNPERSMLSRMRPDRGRQHLKVQAGPFSHAEQVFELGTKHLRTAYLTP